MTGSERGEFTLVGLLVASSLFLVVLGATLTTFGVSQGFVRSAGERAESQTRARAAVDRLARELRSVGAPSATSQQAVETAGASDLVFRRADSRAANAGLNVPNTIRVRWCLDDAGRLWRATQSWTTATAPAAPAAGGCPGGWSGARVVTGEVVNAARGLALFSYDSADAASIRTIRLALAVDADPRGGAAPTTLQTGVFLRNQDRSPAAAFTATVNGQGVITLNGSASQDPEGTPMTFSWKDGATVIGCRAVVCTYDPPGASALRTISLTVTDFGGLTSATATQQVTA